MTGSEEVDLVKDTGEETRTELVLDVTEKGIPILITRMKAASLRSELDGAYLLTQQCNSFTGSLIMNWKVKKMKML